MDDVVNRFARELADAIAAAVAENPQVEACREKARAAGFEMKVTLEAVVGFVSRSQSTAMTKVTAPVRAGRNGAAAASAANAQGTSAGTTGTAGAPGAPGASGADVQPRRQFEVTANDRRFLRSLRIAADETAEPVE